MGDFNSYLEWKHKNHSFIGLMCAAYYAILYSCSVFYKVKSEISKTDGFHPSVVRNYWTSSSFFLEVSKEIGTVLVLSLGE